MENTTQEQSTPQSSQSSSPIGTSHAVKLIAIIGGGVLLIILVVTTMYSLGIKSSTPGKTFCTQEAKLCPDGSYVGRTGPNCSLAQCPIVSPTIILNQESNTSTDTANWKTYTSDVLGASFQYPSNWTIKTESRDIEGVRRTYTILAGAEGSIIIPSTSLGGGCDKPEKIMMDGRSVDICHNPLRLGLESWEPLYNENFKISFMALAKDGSNDASTIKQILSTFKFTK